MPPPNQPIRTPLFLILSLLMICSYRCTPSVTVSSSSVYIGVSTNYSILISNHSSPSTLQTTFTAWSPWQTQPFSTSYKYYLTSGSYSNVQLSCRIRVALLIQCALPTPLSNLGSTLLFTITSINNPSSAKPYTLSFTLVYANSTQVTLSSTLTVTQMQQSTVSLLTYTNNTVSGTSVTSWALSFTCYFDASTILKFVYNPQVITLNLNSITGVTTTITATNSSYYTVMMSAWSDTAKGTHVLAPITITNPPAALTYSLQLLLYMVDSSVQYNIQKYTLTFTIYAASFTAVSATSTLQLGKTNQLLYMLSATCPYTPIDKSSSNASYTSVTYLTTDITASLCTQYSVSGLYKTCSFNTSASSKTITSITTLVTTASTIPLTLTIYTYFSAYDVYYGLCSQTFYVTLTPQYLSASYIAFNTSKCASAYTAALNTNTYLQVYADSVQVGDIITIYGIQGIMVVSSGWVSAQSSTQTKYYCTLASSHIVNSSYVAIPLVYYNPTYLTSTNSITNVTISRVFNTSSTLLYAMFASGSTSTVPVCPVTKQTQLQSVSLVLSSYYTLQTGVTLSVYFRNTITDYTDVDYLLVYFYGYQNVLFLSQLSTYKYTLSGRITTNTVSTTHTVSVVNDTCIKITNLTQLNTISSTINVLYIYNMSNPATVYPIIQSITQYHIVLTTYNGTSTVGKEGGSLTFTSRNNTQTPYTYTYNSISVSQLSQLPILTPTTTSVSFSLSNSNKYKYYSSLGYTYLSVSVPFVCAQTNSSGYIANTLVWNLYTSTYILALTNCTVGYLNSSTAIMVVNESVPYTTNSSAYSISTCTSVQIQLQCMDNCVVCTSQNICRQCVDATLSAYPYLYNNSCVSTCPTSTYKVNTSCISCHRSCYTCASSSALTSCVLCYPNYVFSSVDISVLVSVYDYESICVSVCGYGMYLSTITSLCVDCQLDCGYCMSNTYCYVCRKGATLISEGACDFVVCTQPCQTCTGSMSNCTSCIDSMYLYQNQCYQQCPSNTYSMVDSDTGINECILITTATLYFPATITSIVLIVLALVCNVYIEKNLTDRSRKAINTLTYSSVILAYMELFATLILIIMTIHTNARAIAISGLIIQVLCNLGFGAYYLLVVRNDQRVSIVVEGMGKRANCVYWTVVGLSVGVAMRTYRVLFCGLFRGVAPFQFREKQKDGKEKAKLQSKVKDIQNRKVNDSKMKSSLSPKTISNPYIDYETTANAKKGSHSYPVNINNSNITKTSKKQVHPEITPIQHQHELSSQISSQPSTSSVRPSTKFQLQRPQLMYLTLTSLLGSLLFLSAGTLQIITHQYKGMLFWGLDLLIVSAVSIVVTGLDMWVGIKRSYLMALGKDHNKESNQTMENLGAGIGHEEEGEDQNTQQKILHNVKVTQKVNGRRVGNAIQNVNNNNIGKQQKKKYVLPAEILAKSKSKSPKNRNTEKILSPKQKQIKIKQQIMKKTRNRYNDLYKKKKQQQQKSSSSDNQIPQVKVFEDIQQLENDNNSKIQKSKKLKTSSVHKRMNSSNNISISPSNVYTRNNFHNSTNYNQSVYSKNAYMSSYGSISSKSKPGWKMDDIFLGFKQADEDMDVDTKTVKFAKGGEVYEIKDSSFQEQKKENIEQGDQSMVLVDIDQKDDEQKDSEELREIRQELGKESEEQQLQKQEQKNNENKQ